MEKFKWRNGVFYSISQQAKDVRAQHTGTHYMRTLQASTYGHTRTRARTHPHTQYLANRDHWSSSKSFIVHAHALSHVRIQSALTRLHSLTRSLSPCLTLRFRHHARVAGSHSRSRPLACFFPITPPPRALHSFKHAGPLLIAIVGLPSHSVQRLLLCSDAHT